MSFAGDTASELAGLLSECRSRAEYEVARLEWLERVVGFDASYIGAASPEQARTPTVSGVDTERVSRCEANADRYWEDRLTLQRAALNQQGVVADHDALSLRVRDRMPFYREVVAGHGIRATAVAILRLRGQVSGSIFLGRSSRGARFGSELAVLRGALPVLALGEAVHAAANVMEPVRSFDDLGLTPRECTVVQLLCRGWTNAQIASQLGSSPRTVKNQVAAILQKTHSQNRTELAARLAPVRQLQ